MVNEKRLIDAKDAAESLCKKCGLYREVCERIGFCADYVDIIKLPTVDAVEVVHGHWCWEGRFKACSVCGSYIDWDDTLGANHWSYCPYCGAKMDGDGNGNL